MDLSIKNNNRTSNIELFRIVLMFFIVFHHFIVYVAFRGLLWDNIVDTTTNVAAIINGFPYVAVNCFILISGYFGIKVKVKGLINFYLILFFYAILNLAVAAINGHVEWSGNPILTIKQAVVPVIFCISHCYNWFIPCYFILYLISPLLNAGLDHFDKRGFTICIFLFTIANLYFGYLWEHSYNQAGYGSVGHMIYLYIIGRYINRFVDCNKLAQHKSILLLSYIIFALLWGIATVVQRTGTIDIPPRIWRPWTYNNIFTLLSSISLFLLFSTFSIRKSKIINLIAAGSFAVILVTSAPEFGHLLYNTVDPIFDKCSVLGLIPEYICMIITAFFITIAICLFDSIRRWIMIPVAEKLEKLVSSRSCL